MSIQSLSVSKLSLLLAQKIFESLSSRKFRVVLKASQKQPPMLDSNTFKVFGSLEVATKDEAVNAGKELIRQFNLNHEAEKSMTFGALSSGKSYSFNPTELGVVLVDFQTVDGNSVKTTGVMRWDSETLRWVPTKT